MSSSLDDGKGKGREGGAIGKKLDSGHATEPTTQSKVMENQKIDELRQKLLGISCRNYEAKRFFPRESLKRLMSGDVVRGVLEECVQVSEIDNTLRIILDGGWKVFSILLLLERSAEITLFIDKFHSQLDNGLPLSFITLSDMYPNNFWAPETFFQIQFQFEIPTFSKSAVPYELHTKTILPFTRSTLIWGGEKDASASGQYVFLHSEHNHLTSSKSEMLYLEKGPISNRLASMAPLQHPNIVQVVNAFYHCTYGYLVFPLPTISLEHSLEHTEYLLDFQDFETFITALSGLSSAIESLHDSNMGRTRYGHDNNNLPKSIFVDGTKLILWIDPPRNVSSYPTRRRSDELSHYSAPESLTVRYRPDSLGLESSDIWAFGCVLAELSTCILFGTKGLNERAKEFNFIMRRGKQRNHRSSVSISHENSPLLVEQGVEDWLSKLEVNASQSWLLLIRLIKTMLSFDPQKRPTATKVTRRLRLVELCAKIQRMDGQYAQMMQEGKLLDAARAQQHMFESWKVATGSSNVLHKENWDWNSLENEFDLEESLKCLSTTKQLDLDEPSINELSDMNRRLFELLTPDIREKLLPEPLQGHATNSKITGKSIQTGDVPIPSAPSLISRSLSEPMEDPTKGDVAQEQNMAPHSPERRELSESEPQTHRANQRTSDAHSDIGSTSQQNMEASEGTPLLQHPSHKDPEDDNWAHIKSFFLSDVADFFGIETPLAEGKRRVRWKCRCGKRFYQDFSGNEELPALAFNQDPATEAEVAERAWALPDIQTNDDTQPRPPAQSSTQDADEGTVQNAETEVGASRRPWIIFCIPYWGIVKVKHLPSPEEEDDKSLFNTIRKEYFKNRSCWNRFKNLKAVRSVHIAKFQLNTNKFAGKPEPGSWPCRELSQETIRQTWLYGPCPIKENDKPSSTWMLHLWNNPTHTAESGSSKQPTTPNRWFSPRGFISRILKWKGKPKQADEEAHDDESDDEDLSDAPNRQAVFTATPKKIGSKLTIPPQFDGFTTGWGLYVEEGFHPSRILLAILLVYLVATLAFAVAWSIEHQSGPHAGLGSFGVASWMVAGFALFLSTWFAIMKD